VVGREPERCPATTARIGGFAVESKITIATAGAASTLPECRASGDDTQ
jgi:hypothetical protein